jgi:2-keto-myo-inositol isomerase
MLISWNGETTPNVDLETEIRTAAEVGFDGIEIFVPKLAPYLEHHTARELGRALRDAHLTPVSLNGLENVNLRTPAEFAAVKAECKHLVGIAAEAGCHNLVVVPSPRPQGMSDGDVITESAAALRELAAIAGPHGVSLAFEFLGPVTCSVRTLALTQAIVECAAARRASAGHALDETQLGIVFDTFHFFVGGSTQPEITPAAGRWIRLVHINDVEDKPREQMTDADRLLPGEGVLPLQAMLPALAASGFDGAYSLEVMRPAYRAREIKEYMGEARRQVERALKSVGSPTRG